jgi:hypothetical protein
MGEGAHLFLFWNWGPKRCFYWGSAPNVLKISMTGPIKVAPSKQKKGGKKEEVVAIPMTNSNAKKI